MLGYAPRRHTARVSTDTLLTRAAMMNTTIRRLTGRQFRPTTEKRSRGGVLSFPLF